MERPAWIAARGEITMHRPEIVSSRDERRELTMQRPEIVSARDERRELTMQRPEMSVARSEHTAPAGPPSLLMAPHAMGRVDEETAARRPSWLPLPTAGADVAPMLNVATRTSTPTPPLVVIGVS